MMDYNIRGEHGGLVSEENMVGKEHKVSVKNATDKCQKRTQQTSVRKENKRQGKVLL